MSRPHRARNLRGRSGLGWRRCVSPNWPRRLWRTFNIRKEMPDVELSEEEFKARFRERFVDPAFACARRRNRAARGSRLGGLVREPQSTTHAACRNGIRRSGLRAVGRMDRGARPHHGSASGGRRILPRRAHPAGQRRAPQRTDLPGRKLKNLAAGDDCARGLRARAGLRSRAARPQPAGVGVRPHHLSVQGLRLDRDAALPLAVLLLPQPCDGPGAVTG